MGVATSLAWLRGFLLPDPRFVLDSFDTTNSAYTEQGPIPGVPEPQDETELLLQAVGEQAASTILNVKTNRGGHPAAGARFLWQRDTTDSDWFGHDPACAMSGFQFVDRSTTANKWVVGDIVCMPDQTVVIAVTKDIRQTVVWVRDPTAGTWTEVELDDPGGASTYGSRPCFLPAALWAAPLPLLARG